MTLVIIGAAALTLLAAGIGTWAERHGRRAGLRARAGVLAENPGPLDTPLPMRSLPAPWQLEQMTGELLAEAITICRDAASTTQTDTDTESTP